MPRSLIKMFLNNINNDNVIISDLDQLKFILSQIHKKDFAKLRISITNHIPLTFEKKTNKKLNITCYEALDPAQVEKICSIVKSIGMQAEFYSPFYQSQFGLMKHYKPVEVKQRGLDKEVSYPLCDHNKKLIIGFLPKNACSYTKFWFMRVITDPKKRDSLDENVHDWYWNQHIPQINQGQKVDKKLCKQYFTAMIVRNPYARVVSSFLKILKGKAVQEEMMKVLNIDRKTLLSLTFREFVEALDKFDLDHCDGHLRRQTSCLVWSHPKNIDYIIRLESIRDDLLYLHRHFGYAKEDEKYLESPRNVYEKSDYIPGKTCADIPLNQLMGGFSGIDANLYPHVRNFYTKELKQKVALLFKKDLELLNYRFCEL